MNCPVCNAKMEFFNQDLDEFYYDCSKCSSSLFFKEGKCEILSQGSAQGPAEEAVDEAEKTHGASIKSAEEFSAEESPTEPDISAEEEPDISTEEEEEFPPGDTTQVPELGVSEEDSEDSEAPEEELENLEEGFSEEETQLTENTAQQDEEEVTSVEVSMEPAETELEAGPEAPEQAEEQAETEEPAPAEEEQNFSEEAEEEPAEKSQSENQKEDFSEVAKFGNSLEQDKDGPFLYNLSLNEINSQDVREKVLEVLTDSSLNLPFKEDEKPLQDSIREGQVIIEGLSPVKAYVIVSSLMGLPLQISWTQQHFASQ